MLASMQASSVTQHRTLRPFILILSLVALSLVAFAPSMEGGWIYDDHPLIERNIFIHSWSWWPRWLRTDFWDLGEEIKKFSVRMVYWRPLITASYAIDWAIGRGVPTWFHVTNLVAHALTSVLAFFTLRRWLRGSLWPSFFAALIFALHPTKAESVAWISGRTDIWCALFLMLAAYGAARRLRIQKYGLAIESIATALAYMTKEQAMILPVFLMVEQWVFLKNPMFDFTTMKRLLRASLPQFIVAIVYVSLRAWWLPIRSTAAPMSIPDRCFLVLESAGRYFALTFAPMHLSIQQGLMRTNARGVIFDSTYILLGIIAITLAFTTWFVRKKIPLVLIGTAFFVLAIFPTSNVIPTGMITMISERFLYVPHLGLALAFGALLQKIFFSKESTRSFRLYLASSLSILIVSIFAIQSVRRSYDYSSEKRLWAREYTIHPEAIEPIRFFVALALREERYRNALQLLVEAQRVSMQWYRHTGMEADFVFRSVDVLMQRTTDHDEDSLKKTILFLTHALERKTPNATLELSETNLRPGVHIELPVTRRSIVRRIEKLKPQLTSLLATLESRLGHDTRAVQFALEAQNQCSQCPTIQRAVALVFARAQRFDDAYRSLDTIAPFANDAEFQALRTAIQTAERTLKQSETLSGPAQLHQQATAFSELQAWKHAYLLLAPYKEDIKKAPGMIVGFAELAFRAGDRETAREVLTNAHIAFETSFQKWAHTMKWNDQSL